MTRRSILASAFATDFFGFGNAVTAGQRAVGEYELKAAFLFKITKFVEWPESAFPDAGSPIIFCLDGHNPLGEKLEEVLNGQTVAGRRLRLERFSKLAEARGCHVVFLGGDPIPGIQAPALTVGDKKGFCLRGGMIGLRIQSERLVLEVNLGEVKRAGLRLSAQLLKLAAIVEGAA